ncbi:MAG: hypothetical protein ACREDR_42295 [Blastocatellia bacterium]
MGFESAARRIQIFIDRNQNLRDATVNLESGLTRHPDCPHSTSLVVSMIAFDAGAWPIECLCGNFTFVASADKQAAENQTNVASSFKAAWRAKAWRYNGKKFVICESINYSSFFPPY